jgi:hypothetical protein
MSMEMIEKYPRNLDRDYLIAKNVLSKISSFEELMEKSEDKFWVNVQYDTK